MLDDEVNRAIVEARAPQIVVRANPGDLFFGFPSAAAESIACLAGVTLTYLLDELENIDEDQQRYLQTLVRERREPVGMIVAGRNYGIRTFQTMAAGEVNKPGAEFEELHLDALMREDEREFDLFCRALVERRLEAAGIGGVDFPSLFQTTEPGHLGELLDYVPIDKERVAVERLRNVLTRHGTSDLGVRSAEDVGTIVSACVRPGQPVLEKALILSLYQSWNAGDDLRQEAEQLSSVAAGQLGGKIARLLSHFAGDLVAQLHWEYNRPLEYNGFDTLVPLADGNALNFVNQMKSVVSWSEFMGADVSKGDLVSPDTQRRAVLDGAEWFYGDAQVVGRASDRVRVGMERLAELFEKLRFSDKPVESSLAAFNVDLDGLTDDVRQAVVSAKEWCLLVERPARRTRNDGRRMSTFQVNRMLAPRWNLPTGRRGVIDLHSNELDAMFGTEDRRPFDRVLAARLSRVTAPFARGQSSNPDARLFND